jgi:hypothetical protein
LPAFLARPADAPAYHGFLLVPETLTEGWCFGSISRFEDPSLIKSGIGSIPDTDHTLKRFQLSATARTATP